MSPWNTCRSAYRQLQLHPPRLTKRAGAGHARGRRATTGSGAQLCVINMSELHPLGVKTDSVFSVATNVNTVTKASVDLTGGLFLQVGSKWFCHCTLNSIKEIPELPVSKSADLLHSAPQRPSSKVTSSVRSWKKLTLIL